VWRNCAARSRGFGAAPGEVPLHWYAVYACYRPLHTSKRRSDRHRSRGDRVALAAVRQIQEPLEERRIRPTIPALTEVVDAVSLAVQGQYEANPYPRWLRVRRDLAPASVAVLSTDCFPEADLGGIPTRPLASSLRAAAPDGTPSGRPSDFRDSSVLAWTSA